jgi:hypothetical protein
MAIRYNRFNEAYCTDANAVRHELDRKEFDPSMVYAVEVAGAKDEPRALEVLTNIEGDTVLYIEAATYELARAIAAECDIQLDV